MPLKTKWKIRTNTGGYAITMAFGGAKYGDGKKDLEFDSLEEAWAAIDACDYRRLGFVPVEASYVVAY
jgi:hypothetical protein